MIIDVKQHARANKYDIFIDQIELFHAAFKPALFKAHLELINLNNGAVVFTIKKKYLTNSYFIVSDTEVTYELKSVGFWSTQYRLKFGDDTYHVYQHKARKYSVFHNDIQIAWWDKEKITKREADTYQITANDNCNIELVLCFCLIVDLKDSQRKDKSAITYDFGNIGPVEKKFDENWQPNM